MRVATFEGVVEQGRIRLKAGTILPENTKVYVVVPSMQSEEIGHILSPRLAFREQAADFRMEIIEDSSDAAYDAARFEPPAPLAFVTLQHPGTGAAEQDVPMLLDSGADITLIPQTVADSLGIAPTPDTSYQLMAFDGGTSFASAVRLELVFQRRIFRGQFLLIDQDWGILGRNILNAIALLLDGPNQSWDDWHPT